MLVKNQTPPTPVNLVTVTTRTEPQNLVKCVSQNAQSLVQNGSTNTVLVTSGVEEQKPFSTSSPSSEDINKNHATTVDLNKTKKVTHSWASNYLQSIGHNKIKPIKINLPAAGTKTPETFRNITTSKESTSISTTGSLQCFLSKDLTKIFYEAPVFSFSDNTVARSNTVIDNTLNTDSSKIFLPTPVYLRTENIKSNETNQVINGLISGTNKDANIRSEKINNPRKNVSDIIREKLLREVTTCVEDYRKLQSSKQKNYNQDWRSEHYKTKQSSETNSKKVAKIVKESETITKRSERVRVEDKSTFSRKIPSKREKYPMETESTIKKEVQNKNVRAKDDHIRGKTRNYDDRKIRPKTEKYCPERVRHHSGNLSISSSSARSTMTNNTNSSRKQNCDNTNIDYNRGNKRRQDVSERESVRPKTENYSPQRHKRVRYESGSSSRRAAQVPEKAAGPRNKQYCDEHFDLRSKLSTPNQKLDRKRHSTDNDDTQPKKKKPRENIKITDESNVKDHQPQNNGGKYKAKSNKCRKIRLIINVVCEESDESSDDSSDCSIGSNKTNMDLSFLDDINVDEIVDSLKSSPKKLSSNYNQNMKMEHDIKIEIGTDQIYPSSLDTDSVKVNTCINISDKSTEKDPENDVFEKVCRENMNVESLVDILLTRTRLQLAHTELQQITTMTESNVNDITQLPKESDNVSTTIADALQHPEVEILCNSLQDETQNRESTSSDLKILEYNDVDANHHNDLSEDCSKQEAVIDIISSSTTKLNTDFLSVGEQNKLGTEQIYPYSLDTESVKVNTCINISDDKYTEKEPENDEKVCGENMNVESVVDIILLTRNRLQLAQTELQQITTMVESNVNDITQLPKENDHASTTTADDLQHPKVRILCNSLQDETQNRESTCSDQKILEYNAVDANHHNDLAEDYSIPEAVIDIKLSSTTKLNTDFLSAVNKNDGFVDLNLMKDAVQTDSTQLIEERSGDIRDNSSEILNEYQANTTEALLINKEQSVHTLLNNCYEKDNLDNLINISKNTINKMPTTTDTADSSNDNKVKFIKFDNLLGAGQENDNNKTTHELQIIKVGQQHDSQNITTEEPKDEERRSDCKDIISNETTITLEEHMMSTSQSQSINNTTKTPNEIRAVSAVSQETISNETVIDDEKQAKLNTKSSQTTINEIEPIIDLEVIKSKVMINTSLSIKSNDTVNGSEKDEQEVKYKSERKPNENTDAKIKEDTQTNMVIIEAKQVKDTSVFSQKDIKTEQYKLKNDPKVVDIKIKTNSKNKKIDHKPLNVLEKNPLHYEKVLQTEKNTKEKEPKIIPITTKVNLKEHTPDKNPLTGQHKEMGKLLEYRLLQYMKEGYKIISLIRSGTFSNIYRCKNVNGEMYAVKVINDIRKRNSMGKQKQDMFKVLQRDIPKESLNTVYLIDGFSVKRHWCFLTEYYPRNLLQAMQRHIEPYHIDRVQNLARQLVSAVLMLRHNQIVHSDIKPSHILINAAENRIKLCGFDRSYHIENEQPLPNIGTSCYRAPEVIIGFSAGFSIDVWAVALVILQMATKKKLFHCSVNNDILYQQQRAFGPLPGYMIENSMYGHCHFNGSTFMRQLGQSSIRVPRFQRSEAMHIYLEDSYYSIWAKKINDMNRRELYRKKLMALERLLDMMFQLEPRKRIAIEFVYAEPFIFV